MSGKKPEKRGLARGLSALMADVSASGKDENSLATKDRLVPVEDLFPNPDQPRRDFSDEGLAELANSIREKGIIQPLIVRPRSDPGKYEIVAGERRWRAAQRAQLHAVPVLIREFTDTEVLEIAIIENIQRAELNPVEEALAYRQLMERFGHTQDRLSEALGKSRPYIANLIRLLSLPDDVQKLLREGLISAGHARALITSDNPSAIARQVLHRGLSVRQTESLVRRLKDGGTLPKPRRKSAEKNADTVALERDLGALLRMGVAIDHQNDGSGQMTIVYRSLDDLDVLCGLLGQGR